MPISNGRIEDIITHLSNRNMQELAKPQERNDIAAALRELATIRRDGHAPPGKVLVDVLELTAALALVRDRDECHGIDACVAASECRKLDTIFNGFERCYQSWLEHFGLAEGGDK